MGISHEYHSTSRRRRGGAGGLARLAGAAAGILLVSFAITVILEHGQKQTEELPTVTANGTAQNILAPLPMQGGADSSADSTAPAADGTAAVTLEQFGPARQTAGAYSVRAYDSSVIRQPACGQVDLSYFSDAAFLGDSLTVGFSDYSINLGGALICGYTGVGPDAIVNRSAVKSPTRGQEVALDVLAAAQPKKLYILLGTNTLTTLGASDRFLAYYGQMLDMLRDLCAVHPAGAPLGSCQKAGPCQRCAARRQRAAGPAGRQQGLRLPRPVGSSRRRRRQPERDACRTGWCAPLGRQRLRRMGDLLAQPRKVQR